MAKTPGKVSEADLLGGDDDGETVDDQDLSGLEDLNNEENTSGLLADKLEVVILDEDEGEEEEKAEAAADDDSKNAPDEDEGEEVDSEELTATEKKTYSKAVQDRIMRERRLKSRESARADAAEASARAARGEALAAQKTATSLLAKLLETSVAEKTVALKKAKEDGDTDAEIKLQGELEDLRANKRDVDATKERLDKARPEDAETPKSSPDTDRWLSRNNWYSNKQFQDEALYARTIDVGLGNEFKAGTFKHRPGTAGYFAELDRRIHNKMPMLRQQIRKAYGETRDPAPVVASARRSAPAVSSNRITLTRADLENMRTFGLDTKDPKALREYALQKRGVAHHG